MKIKKISIAMLFLLILPTWLMSQSENVDLSMIYKIKQEGLKNSSIEDLAFWLTDFSGPRLTGSTGYMHANEWAKKKMEELGFQNVRIEEARDFSRGGWDNIKTYAALTAPYYANFACNPVAWTGSTNGLIKSEVVYLDVKAEGDLDKYKGKIVGKIVLMPSTATYDVSYEPLASRLTDAQLKDLSMASSSTPSRRQDDIEYDRGYHTVMDTYERLVMADLKQNAVITASFVYNAAMRNAKLPVKPTMKPMPNASQGPRMN